MRISVSGIFCKFEFLLGKKIFTLSKTFLIFLVVVMKYLNVDAKILSENAKLGCLSVRRKYVSLPICAETETRVIILPIRPDLEENLVLSSRRPELEKKVMQNLETC